eukprot:scaffold10.g2376.t1
MRRDQSLGSLGMPSRGTSAASLGALADEAAPASEVAEAEAAAAAEVAREVAAAVTAAAAAKPAGSPAHVEAIRALRQMLSNYEDPPPPRVDAAALEGIFEATWAVTNLAVGPYDAVKAVLPAAPLLITYLGGGSGLAVAEQCAWALGNIAAEDFAFRQTLIANGATRPLAGLLQARAGTGAAPPRSAPPLARRAGDAAPAARPGAARPAAAPQVGEFMGVDGAPEALVSLLDDAPTDLATEVAWVLTYVTAAHPAHLNRMVHLGALAPLLRRLSEAMGNMAAGGGRDALEQLLSEAARPGVRASHHHGLQREAAWVLANLAGAPGRAGIDALKDAGAVPVLMHLLKDCPFHVDGIDAMEAIQFGAAPLELQRMAAALVDKCAGRARAGRRAVPGTGAPKRSIELGSGAAGPKPWEWSPAAAERGGRRSRGETGRQLLALLLALCAAVAIRGAEVTVLDSLPSANNGDVLALGEDLGNGPAWGAALFAPPAGPGGWRLASASFPLAMQTGCPTSGVACTITLRLFAVDAPPQGGANLVTGVALRAATTFQVTPAMVSAAGSVATVRLGAGAEWVLAPGAPHMLALSGAAQPGSPDLTIVHWPRTANLAVNYAGSGFAYLGWAQSLDGGANWFTGAATSANRLTLTGVALPPSSPSPPPSSAGPTSTASPSPSPGTTYLVLVPVTATGVNYSCPLYETAAASAYQAAMATLARKPLAAVNSMCSEAGGGAALSGVAVKQAGAGAAPAKKQASPAPKRTSPAPKHVSPAPKRASPAPKQVAPQPRKAGAGAAKQASPAPAAKQAAGKGKSPSPAAARPVARAAKQKSTVLQQAEASLEVRLYVRTGSLAEAHAVVDASNAALAAVGGQLAALVAAELGGGSFFAPRAAAGSPACIVDVTCRPSPPPPPPPAAAASPPPRAASPPLVKASVTGDPHIKARWLRGPPGPACSERAASKHACRFFRAPGAGSAAPRCPVLSPPADATLPRPALPSARSQDFAGKSWSIKASLEAWPAAKQGATIMSSVVVRAARSTILVSQFRAKPGAPHMLAVTAISPNGTITRLVAGTRRDTVALPGGATARLAATGRAVIRAPQLAVAITEGMVAGGKTGGYLNMRVAVSGVLPRPVGGLLAAGYVAAVYKQAAASPARAKALAATGQTGMVAVLGSGVALSCGHSPQQHPGAAAIYNPFARGSAVPLRAAAGMSCSGAPAAAEPAVEPAAGGDTLQADAFRRLYPQQYFDRFIQQSVRPDGRPLGAARPTSIRLGVVSTADASALVKASGVHVGSTTALAGIKCEVMPAAEDAPDQGRLSLQVELAPLCSAETRPGRPAEAAAALTERLGELLAPPGGGGGGDAAVDLRQLCIDPGKAAWHAYLDIYVLDNGEWGVRTVECITGDGRHEGLAAAQAERPGKRAQGEIWHGALHDACLLAAVAALSSLRLQAVSVNDAGRVQPPTAEDAAAAATAPPLVLLRCRPVSLTCGLYQSRLLVDPTAEEQQLLDGSVVVTVDEAGELLSMLRLGSSGDGSSGAGGALGMEQVVSEAVEAARLRAREALALLDQAAAVGGGGLAGVKAREVQAAARDSELEAREVEAATRDAALGAREAALADRERELSVLQAELASALERFGQQQAACRALLQQLEAAKRELGAAMAAAEAAAAHQQQCQQARGAPGGEPLAELHAAAAAVAAAAPLEPPPDEGSSLGRLLRALRQQPDRQAAAASALAAALHVEQRPRLAFPPGPAPTPLPAAAESESAPAAWAAAAEAVAGQPQAPTSVVADGADPLVACPRVGALMLRFATEERLDVPPQVVVEKYASKLGLKVAMEQVSSGSRGMGPFELEARLVGHRGEQAYASGRGVAGDVESAQQAAGVALLEALLQALPEEAMLEPSNACRHQQLRLLQLRTQPCGAEGGGAYAAPPPRWPDVPAPEAVPPSPWLVGPNAEVHSKRQQQERWTPPPQQQQETLAASPPPPQQQQQQQGHWAPPPPQHQQQPSTSPPPPQRQQQLSTSPPPPQQQQQQPSPSPPRWPLHVRWPSSSPTSPPPWQQEQRAGSRSPRAALEQQQCRDPGGDPQPRSGRLPQPWALHAGAPPQAGLQQPWPPHEWPPQAMPQQPWPPHAEPQQPWPPHAEPQPRAPQQSQPQRQSHRELPGQPQQQQQSQQEPRGLQQEPPQQKQLHHQRQQRDRRERWDADGAPEGARAQQPRRPERERRRQGGGSRRERGEHGQARHAGHQKRKLGEGAEGGRGEREGGRHHGRHGRDGSGPPGKRHRAPPSRQDGVRQQQRGGWQEPPGCNGWAAGPPAPSPRGALARAPPRQHAPARQSQQSPQQRQHNGKPPRRPGPRAHPAPHAQPQDSSGDEGDGGLHSAVQRLREESAASARGDRPRAVAPPPPPPPADVREQRQRAEAALQRHKEEALRRLQDKLGAPGAAAAAARAGEQPAQPAPAVPT